MKIINSQRGQSMIEFNMALPFIMPIMLVVMMLIVQWGFVYQSKSTLDSATQKAVRAGTLNNGSLTEIRKGLAEGMMPLFAHGTSMSEIGKALIKSRLQTQLLSDIQILNPDSSVFNKFKISRRYSTGRVNEIPNDTLMYRNPRLIEVGGDRKINLQDANLLQIEVRWCQELIVPVANYVIEEIVTSTWYGPSTEQIACNRLSLVTQKRYLALTSKGLKRMQTPFRM